MVWLIKRERKSSHQKGKNMSLKEGLRSTASPEVASTVSVGAIFGGIVGEVASGYPGLIIGVIVGGPVLLLTERLIGRLIEKVSNRPSFK